MSMVLVVDDHRDTCRVLQRYLRMLGRAAAVASSGEEAVQSLSEQKVAPDLILLDIMMPGLNGFQTLEQMRQLACTRAVPIVMLSAISDEDARARARSLGANDYWVKGTFDPRLFEEMLDRYAPVNASAAA